MTYDISTYDDRIELGRYIQHNYSNLYHEAEKLALQTLRAEAKLGSPDLAEPMRSMLRQRWVSRDRPEVNALLADGPYEFAARAAERIVAEHADVIINRCPSCQRIVATPLAQQCLWCLHDWHVLSRPDYQ